MSDTAMLATASRLAAALPAAGIVNIGRGLPTMVASALPRGSGIFLQSENGIVGVGPVATGAAIDPALTDASKQPVTLRPGAALFDLAASFDMIRGGRIDVAVLGAFQVSATGDLANYATDDPDLPPAVGGAMDLAAGAREVWVIMRHRERDGRSKLVEGCSLPLTAQAVVRRVFTEFVTLHLPRGEAPEMLWRDPALTHADLRAILPSSLHEGLSL